MIEDRRKIISRFFIIPQRFVLAIMGFLFFVIAYTLRSNLSLAITQMVINRPHTNFESHEFRCPLNPNTNTTKISIDKSNEHEQFDWSEEYQGAILSAFFWGYIISHLPAGMMATKYGGKIILVIGILTASVFTLLLPLCAEVGGGIAVIISRVLVGIGQGVFFPAFSVLLASWSPLSERSSMVTVVYSGAQVGSIVGSIISGALISEYGWPSVFYFFGGLGIIWTFFFVLLCYSTPNSHPFISEKEKQYLHKEIIGLKDDRGNISSIPWRRILKSPPVIALVLAQIGHTWGLFTMISDLPKYMNDVLHFSIKENGFYSALPYAVMWMVSIFAGLFTDFVIGRNWFSLTKLRKVMTIISSIGPGIFLLAASYAGCDKIIVVTLFSIGMGFMGPFYSGIKANNLDIAPNYTGTIMALTNGIGAISGMIAPYLVGVITTNRLMTEWQNVFWITFGVFIVTTLIYCIYGSAEIQPWNEPEKKRRNTPLHHIVSNTCTS